MLNRTPANQAATPTLLPAVTANRVTVKVVRVTTAKVIQVHHMVVEPHTNQMTTPPATLQVLAIQGTVTDKPDIPAQTKVTLSTETPQPTATQGITLLVTTVNHSLPTMTPEDMRLRRHMVSFDLTIFY